MWLSEHPAKGFISLTLLIEPFCNHCLKPSTKLASLAITPEFLTGASQIRDYITSANLSYPTPEAEIIVSLVDESFRPAILRNLISRITQRAESADLFTYSSE